MRSMDSLSLAVAAFVARRDESPWSAVRQSSIVAMRVLPISVIHVGSWLAVSVRVGNARSQANVVPRET